MSKVETKLGRDTRWNRVLYGFFRVVIGTTLRVWTRGTVAGKEHLPKGAFILAPVHRSYIDTPITTWVQIRRMRYLGKDSVWKYSRLGKLFTAMGAIPVSRGSVDREAMRRCIDVLESGQPLVLFPEGERKDGPTIHPLLDGAAFLASKANVPIVPLGIGDSDLAMPRRARFVHPKKVRVIIGEPFFVERNDNGRATRQQLASATARLHSDLQRLYDQARQTPEVTRKRQ
jgi:1-acyl-sn-glycerol-3-phosphate acyltransferase